MVGLWSGEPPGTGQQGGAETATTNSVTFVTWRLVDVGIISPVRDEPACAFSWANVESRHGAMFGHSG